MPRFISEFRIPGGINLHEKGRAMDYFDPCVMKHGVEGDGCFFVRLHSWDMNKTHPLFNQLKNRKVRVTVETVDE